jgi:hypothetical protein
MVYVQCKNAFARRQMEKSLSSGKAVASADSVAGVSMDIEPMQGKKSRQREKKLAVAPGEKVRSGRRQVRAERGVGLREKIGTGKR